MAIGRLGFDPLPNKASQEPSEILSLDPQRTRVSHLSMHPPPFLEYSKFGEVTVKGAQKWWVLQRS